MLREKELVAALVLEEGIQKSRPSIVDQEEPAEIKPGGPHQWPGRCKRCHIVWWWAKNGHTLHEDIAKKPTCHQCGRPLSRTTSDTKDEFRYAWRQEINLPA